MNISKNVRPSSAPACQNLDKSHGALSGASALLDTVQNASNVGGKKWMTFNKGCDWCVLHGLIHAVFLMCIFSDQFMLLHGIDRLGIGSFSWTASFIIKVLIGLNDNISKVTLKSSLWVFKAERVYLKLNKAIGLMTGPIRLQQNQWLALTNNTSLTKQMLAGVLYLSIDSLVQQNRKNVLYIWPLPHPLPL